MTAFGVAFAAGVLVFLSIVGVIGLLNETQTLHAVNHNTKVTEQLEKGAADFFAHIGPEVRAWEINSYQACVAVHATYCIAPKS